MTERLPTQPWMTAAPTRAVLAALETAGGPGCARFVGGCVRDALLGRASADIDLATPLTPPQVLAALARAGVRAVPTGVEHGVVTAVSGGRPYEVATLRRDVETDGRRAVVAFTDDWAQDAARRDFRLNALYAEGDGTLHDPTGGGVADALAGRVVFVGDPSTRIREDYLRILRFFRFTAWYGREGFDARGLAACAALREGLHRLSAERVAKELLKLLAAPDPRPAIRAMAETGVLAELLPEAAAGLARLDRLVEVDVGQGFVADGELRLAALLPGDAAAVRGAAARLRLSNAARDRLVAAAGEAPAVGAGEPALRRALHRLGASAFRDRARLAWATGGGAEGWRALHDLPDRWTAPPFPLTGADLAAAGVPEGPGHGRLRRDLERGWVERDFAPDRAALLAELAARTAPDAAPSEQVPPSSASSPPAGYSGKALGAKLGVKPGDRVLALGAPEHYATLLAPLPPGAEINDRADAPRIVHAFFQSAADLAEAAPRLATLPRPGGMLWISWPKKTSPLRRDLTEDGVRAALLPTGWVDVKVAAVDRDWSALKFLRRRTG